MLLLLSRSRRPIIYSNNGIMNWGHGVYSLFVLLMINYLLLEIMHFGCHVYWWFLGSSWGFIWLGFHFITCTCCCVLNLTFENHFGYLYIYICIYISPIAPIMNSPQPRYGNAGLLTTHDLRIESLRELGMIEQVRLNLSKCPTLKWVNRGFI